MAACRSRDQWPSPLVVFWETWVITRPSTQTKDLLARFLALWHHRPNSKGGAREWRSEASTLHNLVFRWADAESEPHKPARPSSADVVLFLSKTMLNLFKSNNMVTWKPLVALALGILGVDADELLMMSRLGLRTARGDVPLVMNLLISKFGVDTRKPFDRFGCDDEVGPSVEDDARARGVKRVADVALSACPVEEKQRLMIEVLLQSEFSQYHEILGVDVYADAREVRRAYRRIALLVHPDKCKHTDAAKAFRLVRMAYEAMEV